MESKNYYIGLDIGTDSIGYAAADESYRLLKYKGEPVWGSHIIEEANLKTERRQHRTERRRLDRRQQRVTLIREIFAKEIAKIDPDFYKREEESALLAEDASTSKGLFTDIGYTDKEYHKSYPTIHHLINELMTDAAPHDVRLVYLACAWLVAHRGHFLSEVSLDNVESVVDFKTVYDNLTDYFAFEIGCEPAWDNADPDEIEKILVKKIKSTSKINELNNLLFGKKKPETEITDAFPFSRPGIIKLLCGGTCSAKDLFGKEEYAEIKSLKLDDDELDSNLSELGDDAELVLRLKAVYDCVTLHDVLGENKFISAAKVETYEQHKRDLAELKKFIKKYAPEKYNEIFRKVDKSTANYSAYSGNIKSDKDADWKKATPEAFCAYILKIVRNITPDAEDKAFFDDMVARLQKDVNTFMPKQVNGDNRVIPYQLYYVELKKILENAEKYLPFLSETDEEGYLTKDKILSVFTFRIPYYVGPLNASSPYAWIKRKAGRITPWNFSEMVDGNESEQGFINKLIGVCSYLPGEKVLPKQSLLYQRFTVLNEINNITINGLRISPEIKQLIYNDVFKKNKKVSVKKIKDSLRQNTQLKDDVETIAGIDISIKSSLSSYISFRRLLESGTLNETDVEKIIKVSTYMESRPRFKAWLEGEYPNLSDNDVKYITSLKFKDFGRLSEKFLCAILGSRKNNEKEDNGEACSIIDALWSTDKNLMELLSDDYTYSDAIKRYSDNYYMANGAKSLDERMDDMYLSNAVRRPIYRVLDIVSDIVKAEGKAPNKIFVEMARGAKPDEKKGQRKTSRYDTLKDLYKNIDTDDVRRLEQELEKMGDEANSRLQSEKLFLYFLQLGKCMYSGEKIILSDLMTSDKRYDIDHIYPQSKVKDDSLFNNKVLVKSELNHQKGDRYPVPEGIRENMSGIWKKLLDGGLITEEKYRRLTRKTGFTDDEAWGFINRQMVETRQSTKAVATLLKEYYPDTEIVYVKAGLVSEFRHEKKLWKAILPEEERYLDDSQIEPWKTELWKSRTVNDLHHAKDAYLNIVAGNVYHEKCTKQWYLLNKDNYSINLTSLYSLTPYTAGGRKIWDGVNSLETVWKTVHKNAVHYTIYPFSRKGGLFDQNPLKKNADLTPLKNNGEIYLDPEKYGGYNKPTATFFVLVKYYFGKKSDVMLMPVDLAIAEKYKSDSQFRFDYAKIQLGRILNKTIDKVEFPLGDRIIKVKTMIELDGYRMCITGKAGGGTVIMLSSMTPLCLAPEWEFYVKKLETLNEKKKNNPNMVYMEKYDFVSTEKNAELYDILTDKLTNTVFNNRPGNPYDKLATGKEKFAAQDVFTQTACLLQIVGIFGRINNGFDLTAIDEAPKAARSKLSSNLSNWKKSYSDVRIIDTTASGLFEHRSCNLLDLL